MNKEKKMTKEKNKKGGGKQTALANIANVNLDIQKCKFNKTELWLSPTITEDDFMRVGEFLNRVDVARKFWMGDWINFGKKRFSHGKYNDALKIWSLRYGTLANIASVCEKVSFRNENLSFAHHQVVAPLPRKEHKLWLEDAEINGWGAKELRRRVKDNLIAAEKKCKNKESIYVTTKNYAYSYAEYIKLVNSSVRGLTNKIKNLTNLHGYVAKPQLCETKEERELTKNCSRLFWKLERLLNGQLSILATLSENGQFPKPLLFEDVCKDYPSFELIGAILEAQPWKKCIFR